MSEYKHMTHKFRPVLTLEQIHHISHHFQQNPQDTLGQSILKVLIPLIAKIEVGAINPAYKLSETHALKLAEAAERQKYENGLMSTEEEARYETEILGV